LQIVENEKKGKTRCACRQVYLDSLHMNYFIKEIINGDPNAGSKARNDVSAILEGYGLTPLLLNFIHNEKDIDRKNRSLSEKVRENLQLRVEWRKRLKEVNCGDTVVVQFPIIRRPIFLTNEFKKLKRRGAHVVLLVHDLEVLRVIRRTDTGWLKKTRIRFEEITVMNDADHIIVHNGSMKKHMIEMGFHQEQLIELHIFDYLIPNFSIKEKNDHQNKDIVAIAGTLRVHKTKYLEQLPENVVFHLYGVGYEDQGQKNIQYFGAFPPDELPMSMKAGFGLVWDGESSESCTGVYGEYLRINNPHKTSLYLAAGIPVIIWKEAALADFVINEKCGLVINSLNEIHEAIANVSADEYYEMKNNALKISEKLRDGYYTINALKKIGL